MTVCVYVCMCVLVILACLEDKFENVCLEPNHANLPYTLTHPPTNQPTHARTHAHKHTHTKMMWK